MKSVSDSEFETKVVKSSKPVLVDFWAEWCGPCKMVMPMLEEIEKELSDKIDFMKLNIDDSPETPTKYGLKGVPTFMVFKEGEVVDVKVGASLGKADLQAWIETHL